MTETKLEPAVEEFLKGKGYQVLGRLGEGFQRDVYEAEYSNGSLRQKRVIKIPKTDMDECPVTAAILRSKGDIDEREVKALNDVNHKNVVKILDAFKIGERTLTVEEHYNAISLEDLIKMSGPLRPERFKDIFSQVKAGLEYLHGDARLLHRDIKPSNILVGKKGNDVKISDLQTAGKIDEMEESFLPTRGGTRFTAPYLLNALVSGQKTKTGLSSEFYALGATMFYALTGKPLFDRELVSIENGTPIMVNGKEYRVTLKLDGKPIAKIDLKEHDKLLTERLENVPRQYRKLLHNCLSAANPEYTDKNPAHYNFEQDFEKATSTENHLWENIKSHAKLYIAVAGILSGVIGGIKFMALQEKIAKRNEPSVYDILSRSPFQDGGLECRLQDNSIEIIKPHFKEIEKSKNNLYTPQGMFDHELENACGMQGISNRLGFSLIRAIQLEDDKVKQDEYGDTRYPKNLLPKEFIKKAMTTRTSSETDREVFYSQSMRLPIIYLRQSIGNSSSLPDALAEYFCDKQELFEARKKANSLNYFPTQEKPGYSSYLSPVKQGLINRTIALYTVTDNEGTVHLEILDSNNRLKSGLPVK